MSTIRLHPETFHANSSEVRLLPQVETVPTAESRKLKNQSGANGLLNRRPLFRAASLDVRLPRVDTVTTEFRKMQERIDEQEIDYYCNSSNTSLPSPALAYLLSPSPSSELHSPGPITAHDLPLYTPYPNLSSSSDYNHCSTWWMDEENWQAEDTDLELLGGYENTLKTIEQFLG